MNAGIAGGYLTSARLRLVRWQPGDRPPPAPRVSIAGESALYVDAGESALYVDQEDIPAHADVTRLARALAACGAEYE